MAKTKLNQETINTTNVTQDCVPVGDLGITGDNVPSEIVEEVPTPVEEVSTTTETEETPATTEEAHAPVEESPAPINTSAKAKEREKVKVPKLVRKNGISHWEMYEQNKLKRNPFQEGKLEEVADKIYSNSFKFENTLDTTIKGFYFIEPRTLRNILKEVMAQDMLIDKVKDEVLYIMYLCQERYIAQADLNGSGVKYVLGEKLKQLLQ